jgi:hypothetical protein
MNEAFVSGKLRMTRPPFTEYDVCIRFVAESTYSGTIAVARMDGTPIGGDETMTYSLSDLNGNTYRWRWSGKFIGTFYLGEVVNR